MPPPIITEGTGYVLFAYDVAHAFDLAAAETRLASATQRQTVKQKRRAPAFFEYDPAPLRVTEPADSLAVGEHVTAPYVEFVLYDFGAVSVSYAIPLQGPLTGLPALSTMLYGNEQLQADSRRRVQQLIEALGDAAIRSRLADFERLRGVPDRGVHRAARGVHAVDRERTDGGPGAARRVAPPVAAGSERRPRVAPLVRAERRDADRHRRDPVVRPGGGGCAGGDRIREHPAARDAVPGRAARRGARAGLRPARPLARATPILAQSLRGSAPAPRAAAARRGGPVRAGDERPEADR